MDFQRITCSPTVFAKHMPQTKSVSLFKQKQMFRVRSQWIRRARQVCIAIFTVDGDGGVVDSFCFDGAPHSWLRGASRAAPAAAASSNSRRTRGYAGPHAPQARRRVSRHAGRPAFVLSCRSHRHASCKSPPGGSPHTAARPTSGSLRRYDLAARATWQLAPPSSASPSSGGPPGETNSRGGT